jgi:hypothetical protein
VVGDQRPVNKIKRKAGETPALQEWRATPLRPAQQPVKMHSL